MARNFIEFEYQSNVNEPTVDEAKRLAFVKSSALAARFAESYANHLKITLLRVKAFATGDTLRSVKDEMILQSPSRSLVMSRVIASRSIVNIQTGRKAGKKAPVKLVSIDEKGKKQWELLPELARWATALGIPKAAWLPIAWAIKRRGIPPREVQKRAVNSARSNWESSLSAFAVDFIKTLFKPYPRS